MYSRVSGQYSRAIQVVSFLSADEKGAVLSALTTQNKTENNEMSAQIQYLTNCLCITHTCMSPAPSV